MPTNHAQRGRSAARRRGGRRQALAPAPLRLSAAFRAAPAAVRSSVARAPEEISGQVSSAKCRRLHRPTAGRFLRRLPPRLPWPSRAIPGPPSPSFPFGLVRQYSAVVRAFSGSFGPRPLYRPNGPEQTRTPFGFVRLCPVSRIEPSTYCVPKNNGRFPHDHERRRRPPFPGGFPPRQSLRPAQGVLCRALIGKHAMCCPSTRGCGFAGPRLRLAGGRSRGWEATISGQLFNLRWPIRLRWLASRSDAVSSGQKVG